MANAVASTTSPVRRVVDAGRNQVAASRRATVAHALVVERDAEILQSFEAELACEPCRMYYGRRGGGDSYVRPPAAEEGLVVEKNTGPKMVAAFEAALVGAGRNAQALCEMSTRAWRELGDADRVEQLYLEALQIAPDDSAVQASYARFLWQCDV